MIFRGLAADTTSAPDLASLVARHSGLVVARRSPTIPSKGGPETEAPGRPSDCHVVAGRIAFVRESGTRNTSIY